MFNMLLQILDDGILTDSQGRKVDFKNTIIIMTSNLGAKIIAGESKSIGFGGTSQKDSQERIKSAVTAELKKTFRPEFINRIDEIIVFNQLEKEQIKEIAKRMLDKTKQRLSAMSISMTFTDGVIEKISDEGFDPVYGARPLRRAIQSKIEDKLSEQMLDKKILPDKSYKAVIQEGEIDFIEV